MLAPEDADDRAGRLRRVRTADGRQLEADAFVLAAGPWLPRLVPALGGQIAVTRQEIVFFATPPGDGRFDAGSVPTWVDYDAAFYGLPSIEGRGFKVAPDWPGPIVDPDHEERRLSDERVDAARAFLARRFPALAAQPVAEGRVCQYETTPDTHFVIDRDPRWENAWVVGGGSGHGFKHGPVIGEYLSALVTGEETPPPRWRRPDERFALRTRTPARGCAPRRRGRERRAPASRPGRSRRPPGPPVIQGAGKEAYVSSLYRTNLASSRSLAGEMGGRPFRARSSRRHRRGRRRSPC